jgi:hypothetical protein
MSSKNMDAAAPSLFVTLSVASQPAGVGGGVVDVDEAVLVDVLVDVLVESVQVVVLVPVAHTLEDCRPTL